MKKLVLFVFILLINLLSAQENIDSLFFKGEYLKLIPILKNEISDSTENIELMEKLGICYQNNFKYFEAKETFNSILKTDSLNLNALKNLGNIELTLGNKSNAIKYYELVGKIDSLDRSTLTKLGNLYLDSSELLKGEKIFLELTEVDTSNYFYQQRLGLVYYKMKQFDYALQAFEKSHSLNPADPNNILYMGNIYVKKDSLSKALELVDLGLDRTPNNLKLNKLKAEILFKQKDYFASVKSYLKLIVRGDSTSTNYQKLGLSYFFIATNGMFSNQDEINKKLNSSVEMLLKSYKIDDQNAYTCLYLGAGYKELGDYENAKHYLNESLNILLPDYLGDIYVHLAASFEKNNELSEAIKLYKKSLEYKNNVSIFLQLASIYDRFYADRSVPLIYYQTFLNKFKDTDPRLIKYANERIEVLKEQIHFHN